MTFRGLFIGVDRYSSPLVDDLSCSARDAIAMSALCADTLAGAPNVLLANEDATRSAVLSHIADLKRSDPDDLVLIHFSGHGSDSHYLIPHDCDPLDLGGTCIALEELVREFADIPARNVLLVLDCCFAGGAGAKVFRVPSGTRGIESAESLLEKISGRGRVILTAATADQEAIEDRRTGHGLLTQELIRGLLGAPEILDNDRVPLLALANFVTQAVQAAAAVFRHVQTPTLRGALDGDIRLPRLIKGEVFRRHFPEKTTAVVASDLASLSPYGFSADMIDAIRQAIPTLNQLQLDAINRMGLFEGRHLVVSAPTSSGKTMIGELAALRAHTRGERSYLLLPLKALVNDKYQELRKKYAALGVRVIRSTGEIADDNDALMRGKFDIALLTYEKFAALSIVASFILKNVGVIVVDEVQMLTDIGRGAGLEFLLTYLRAQRKHGIEPQMIALSAVIGSMNGFERWLDASLLVSRQRPVPLAGC